MDLLLNNWDYILGGAALLYPPLLYVLPKAQAGKIKIGVTLIRKLAESLEEAADTKGGLSKEKEV